MLKKIGKVLIPIICLIPLLMGTIGYLCSGEMVTNSLYASFALYFTNPVSDAYNGWIEFARWTAPLVTATAILCVLKTVWQNLKWRLSLLGRNDSVAVYSDEEISIQFENGTRAIYPKETIKKYAKEHILMFSTDEKNLQFYEEHKAQLSGKAVYIGLKELELGSIKEMKNVTLFDSNGSVARLLWREIAVWKMQKEDCKIVVYGNGALAQAMLEAGLQWNLFSTNQQVCYDVISSDQYFQHKHPDMQLMNGDSIHYFGEEEEQIWDRIAAADIVIVAEKIPLERLLTIAVRAGNTPVYYYSPEEGEAANYLAFENLIPYGRNEELLTDGNIRKQELIRRAILLNEHYVESYQGEKDWNSLSGFLKASNISSADYGEVVAAMPPDVPDETLARLEHIRWCRFYFLNYWKYGIPENGKGKDPKKRIHKDLVPYEDLAPEERVKDILTIQTWRKQVQE